MYDNYKIFAFKCTIKIDLWKKMNGWVYKGFNETFNLLGVDFEKDYLVFGTNKTLEECRKEQEGIEARDSEIWGVV